MVVIFLISACGTRDAVTPTAAPPPTYVRPTARVLPIVTPVCVSTEPTQADINSALAYTGDLFSERAYIRLDRLSCISEDGGALDVAVKGYIADQTGKAGVRGRLVSKQGQVLANALLAGVASGIGTAFSQGAMTTSVSPLGSTSSVKDGQQLQAGVGQGVGNALQQRSRYYIQLAEKLFPVIEVDAGQPVDIVITKGVVVARK